MDQTPIHDQYNPDLLRLIPTDARRVVEVGCSSGALARAYRPRNPSCDYVGIEIDPSYAETARPHCSSVVCGDIESFDDATFRSLFPSSCWIFGDVLEHLRDPWAVLRKLRSYADPDFSIVACIPNAQHWSLQVSLNAGLFRYQDQGLLDRTHLRWFTRLTMIEMFRDAGFTIVEGFPRIFNEPGRDQVLPAIRNMAASIGIDPKAAVQDALPLQYVVRAIPSVAIEGR